MSATRILVLISLVAVAILSLVPGDFQFRTGLPKELEHFGAYFAVAFLVAAGRATTIFAVSTALLLSGLACAMELLQEFVPGRNAGVFDAAASALGAVAGAGAAHFQTAARKADLGNGEEARAPSPEQTTTR